ncbi:MAG: molecular chaperone SurA [Gammaproteobacteria bacterium]|jgi:peptidyl-prolyl cis-trans isomerase SurA|nr:molecular chaperone SurA [Gammaproteobacteria bacterium]MBT5205338.1 molecular chaperone SurA [Gammaproteobacteria bacterium]MBT5601513.1 molecular chaperone SurA [Gammaproteobacteria bacterium]MBT6244070.1 molecular chaperone SurA [Gammaproteobacteria bacterium]
MNIFGTGLLLYLVILSSTSQAAPVVLDKIAAIVDNEIIMVSELESRKTSIKAQLTDPMRIPSDEILTNQIIERLVIESLQMQMARRAGVRVSDGELNEAMNKIAAQNNLSLQEFSEVLVADGISYNSMREQVQKEIMISRVQQGIMRNRIEITDQAIDNFLGSELGQSITADEYRFAHILMAVPSGADSEVIKQIRQQARDTLEEINAGADFQKLAMERSSGQNALKGGDLGWRKPDQLPSMFADIAETMKLGEVKGPIQSGSGFHIIKLEESRGARSNGFIDQTRTRHVLIKTTEIRTLEEAKELAMSLRDEIMEGREFGEVARLYSDDPGSALNGGDLGWSRAGEFVGAFEETVSNSEIDEVSGVFETAFGFHFLEVTGRRTEDFSNEFMRTQAENYLRSQMVDEELENWTRELREDAFVEIRI